MHLDWVARSNVLMLFEDTRGVFDLTASEVLQFLIGVEPSSTLADLSNPWPDLLRRCIDRNCVIRGPLWIGDELVAWIGFLELFVGRSPSTASGPEEGSDESDAELEASRERFNQ